MKKIMIAMFICTLIGSSSFAQTQQDTSSHKTNKQQKKNKRSKRDTSRTDTMRHQSTPPKS